jgi:hypothetical protein
MQMSKKLAYCSFKSNIPAQGLRGKDVFSLWMVDSRERQQIDKNLAMRAFMKLNKNLLSVL